MVLQYTIQHIQEKEKETDSFNFFDSHHAIPGSESALFNLFDILCPKRQKKVLQLSRRKVLDFNVTL